MAKQAKNKPEPLPVPPKEFERLVAAARREDQREALLNRVLEEYPARGQRSRRNTPARQLFEARLLAMAKTPALTRDPTLPLEFSHMDVWAELLELRSEGFARLLRSFLKSRDRSLRGEAAEHLAWLAFDEDTPRILKLIMSDDSHLVAKAAGGAANAASWKYASRDYRSRLFKAIARILRGEQKFARHADQVRSIPECVVDLDRRAAVALLRSRECLHAENPLARDIVNELVRLMRDLPAREWSPVDPELLWSLFAAARQNAVRGVSSEDSLTLAADVLNLTAECAPTRTRREAKDLLKATPRSHDSVRRVLREALLRCENVPDALSLWEWIDRNPGRLPEAATQTMRAFELSQVLMSDGLVGYFDSVGQKWPQAHAGLKRLKLTKEASLLERAAKTVAAQPKPLDRLREALDGLAPGAEKELMRIGAGLEERADAIATAVERFMVARPALFRAQAK